MLFKYQLPIGQNVYDANNRLFSLSNGQYLFVGIYEYFESEGLDASDEDDYDEDSLVDGDPIDWKYSLFDNTGKFISGKRLCDPDNYMEMNAEDAAEEFINMIFGEKSGITFEPAKGVVYDNIDPMDLRIK